MLLSEVVADIIGAFRAIDAVVSLPVAPRTDASIERNDGPRTR
jgi:hypothetical protein